MDNERSEEDFELDGDYREMQKAEKKIKLLLSSMGYQKVEPIPKCCMTCKKSIRLSNDDPLECGEVKSQVPQYSAVVEELSVCDVYAGDE